MKDTQADKTTLAPKQERLLIELVKTPDIQAAAKAAGVGRTTAYRWLEQPEFAEELAKHRNQTMNDALNGVKSLTTKAAKVMQELLDSENESVRRMVCRDILKHAVKVRELENIEARLSALEKQLNT